MHVGKTGSLRSERTLSWRTYLRTLRDAPKDLRVKFARRLVPNLFRTEARSTADSCEFYSLVDYETKYRLLAKLLDRTGKAPPRTEIEFLRSIEAYAGRAGTINLGDCLFLTAFASILAPSRAIEIGTLGGFSAAMIAAAIHGQLPTNSKVLVDTIDRHTRCLVEPDKRVGFLIREMSPTLADVIRIHAPAEADIVCELADPDEIEFAFIDADHQHPRPLLDLVRLIPFMRGGGWIVLHDIQLGSDSLAKGNRESLPFGAQFGAEWLFNGWPFRKISGGNIGAVQVPADKTAVIPLALELMRLPFEVRPSIEMRRVRRALHQTLAQLW